MTATLNAMGIRPAYDAAGSGAGNAVSILGGIASGYGTNIFKYQPVTLNSSGNIIAATVGADIYGIFAGFAYTDSNGFYREQDNWIAGTTYTGGAASPTYAMVWNDPGMVYTIQADGAVASSVGGQVNFSNISAGSTVTGLSACTAGAASLTTSAQAQLRILALDPQIGNAWGDAFTVLQVQIAQSQFTANKVAV